VEPPVSHASNLLANIIASEKRRNFEIATQALVERDFLQRFAGCDYASAETEFDRLGATVAHCVNSPTGRALLANALTTRGSPVFLTTIN
jgi:hypothetical protein